MRQIAALKRKLRRETGLLNTCLVREAAAALALRREGQDVEASAAVQGRGLGLGYPTVDVGIRDILVLKKGRNRKNDGMRKTLDM